MSLHSVWWSAPRIAFEPEYVRLLTSARSRLLPLIKFWHWNKFVLSFEERKLVKWRSYKVCTSTLHSVNYFSEVTAQPCLLLDHDWLKTDVSYFRAWHSLTTEVKFMLAAGVMNIKMYQRSNMCHILKTNPYGLCLALPPAHPVCACPLFLENHKKLNHSHFFGGR